MKLSKLREEVKLTLNLMQQDIDDDAHSELRMHLREVLLLKREVLQQDDEEYAEDVPMHSVVMTLSSLAPSRESEQIEVGEALFRTQFEPKRREEIALTAEELKAGDWWLDGAGSQSLLELFREYGVNITGVSSGWFDASVGVTCVISSSDYGRDLSGFKQIKLIGNEFYWAEL